MMMGVFLVSMGLTKIDWLMDGGILVEMLQEWRGTARPLARWYLDTVAIPGAPVFARVVFLAEVVAGAALVLGVRVRLTAARTATSNRRLVTKLATTATSNKARLPTTSGSSGWTTESCSIIGLRPLFRRLLGDQAGGKAIVVGGATLHHLTQMLHRLVSTR